MEKTIKGSVMPYLDIKDYLADTSWASSDLKRADRSLLEAIYFKGVDMERKAHFDFGNAFECELMGEDFKYIVFDPDLRPEPEKAITSKANQAWKKEVLNGEKYVINIDDRDRMQLMLKGCRENKHILALLKNTQYQLSLFWECSETGLSLKTRPDVCKVKQNVIVDIKTTIDASPWGFQREVTKFGYPIQAALQIEGAIQTGLMEKVDHYFWLAVQKEAPYDSVLYRLSAEDRELLKTKLREIKQKVAEAQQDNQWPGYEQQGNEYGVVEITLPDWYYAVH